MPLNLNPQQQEALSRLSQHLDFWALKQLLKDWKQDTNSLDDIDLSADPTVQAAQVAGKKFTIQAIDALLEAFVIDLPRAPRIDTHE
jgi:hypothetical protein